MSTTTKKRIAVLGSTGSVGRQTLEVIAGLPDYLELAAITAANSVSVLQEQARQYKPKYIGITNTKLHDTLSRNVVQACFCGDQVLEKIATLSDVDIVVVGTTGIVALPAIIAAINESKIIVTANKETLVAAGDIIMPLLKHPNQLRTIDSEHSAIWQCLIGEEHQVIKRLLLTASGGPFRDSTLEQLNNATVSQALKHPNWSMGSKITIDSATLMNKGFEIIEAHRLFNVPYEQINVLIHRESIIHSLVEFIDGSTKAQLAVPDMRIMIQYALMYPKRSHNLDASAYLDWSKINELSFELPDISRFPCFMLGYEAGKAGNTYPAVLVATDEVVVRAFLNGSIGLMDIPAILTSVLERHAPTFITVDSIHEAMMWANYEATQMVKKRSRF